MGYSKRDTAVEMMELYDSGGCEQALQLGRRYLTSDGKQDAEAWSVHALVAMELNNLAEAMVAANTAQELAPQDTQCLEVKTLIEESRRHAANSTSLYERVWNLDSMNPEYGLHLHRALRNAGRIGEASNFAEQLLERFPRNTQMVDILKEAQISDRWIHSVDSGFGRQIGKEHECGTSAKRGFASWLGRFLEIDASGEKPFVRLSLGHRIVLGAKWVLAVICAVYVLMFTIGLICVCLMYPVGWLILAIAVILVIKRRCDNRQKPLRR